VKEYQSPPGAWRAFCSSCGSPAYGRTDRDPNHIRIRLGTLPRTAEASITAHVWVGSKAAWDSITFDVPKYLKSTDGALMASDDLGHPTQSAGRISGLSAVRYPGFSEAAAEP